VGKVRLLYVVEVGAEFVITLVIVALKDVVYVVTGYAEEQ